MNIKELIGTEVYGDWTNALAAAGADGLAQDTEVIWSEEGENDGPAWRAIFRTSPATVMAIRSWCDYTGWDCQSGGEQETFGSEAEARAWLEKKQ